MLEIEFSQLEVKSKVLKETRHELEFQLSNSFDRKSASHAIFQKEFSIFKIPSYDDLER